MVLPFVPLALAAAEFAPRLVSLIAGEDAGDVAEKVVDTVKQVTGHSDPHEAVEALKADPELQIKFRQVAADLEVRILEANNERLRTINKTMRAEATSGDGYVRRWRPTFGYSMCAAWVIQVIGSIAAIIYAVVFETTEAALIITAVGEANAATVPMWGIALTVIGVSVTKRSQDKAVASGQAPPTGLIGALINKVSGGG
jgi:hypothetical protein